MTSVVENSASSAVSGRDRNIWRGIHAVMVTPFQRDLSLDEQGLRANVEFLATSPVDAVLCLGSEGEFYALSDDERRRVAEITVETLGGRKPVAVGVSHASAVQSVELTRHAAAIGATAVLSTAPYFGQPPLAEIRDHFAQVAAVGIPVFVYNTPSRVGYSLSPEDIAAIAQVDGVIGIKQAAPDVSELVELLETMEGSGCLVIGGSENTIWPALSVGAVGNTATAASAIPRVFARFWELAAAGRLDDGRDLYRTLAPLRRAYAAAGGQAAVVKRLMDIAGLAGGPVRPPVRPATADIDPHLDKLIPALTERGLWAAA
jgi:4-hydroxy-tetrahydrodipicolinate synthase